MDAELARQLFFHGATLLLLDAPHGTEVGVDDHLWAVTDRFAGVKMIPPGVHCLFYRQAELGVWRAVRPVPVLTGGREDMETRAHTTVLSAHMAPSDHATLSCSSSPADRYGWRRDMRPPQSQPSVSVLPAPNPVIVYARATQVVVQRWDTETETFVDVATAFGPTDNVNYGAHNLTGAWRACAH